MSSIADGCSPRLRDGGPAPEACGGAGVETGSFTGTRALVPGWAPGAKPQAQPSQTRGLAMGDSRERRHGRKSDVIGICSLSLLRFLEPNVVRVLGVVEARLAPVRGR